MVCSSCPRIPSPGTDIRTPCGLDDYIFDISITATARLPVRAGIAARSAAILGKPCTCPHGLQAVCEPDAAITVQVEALTVPAYGHSVRTSRMGDLPAG